MKNRTVYIAVAMGLSFIGIVFFLLGAFDLTASMLSIFLGVVFVMASDLTWTFWPKKSKKSA